MSNSFAITTAANSIPLDGNRKGQTVFTVSNTSVRALRGRAQIVPDNAATAAWFTLAGGAERDFSVRGTQQYTVQIAVPPTAAAGNYTVRLDMVGVDNPDEDFTQGPSVIIAAPAPLPVKKPFPWWIIAVGVGVVIVGIILAVVLSPKQVEVPKLVGSPLMTAQPMLEAAGLKLNLVLAPADSAKQNMVMAQDPAGGVRVQSGSGVTLTVGVVKPITSTSTPVANAYNADLLDGQDASVLVPPGTVVAFAGSTPPLGWLLCDGSAVTRAQYPALFAAIGTAHGKGDDSTTFNLPDYRGRFLRGRDGGAGRDPDQAARTAANPGGNTGDEVGSLQGDATKRPTAPFIISVGGEHVHSYADIFYSESKGTVSVPDNLGSNDTDHDNLGYQIQRDTQSSGKHSHTIASGGDNETRPINAYVNWIIKY